MLKIDLHPSRRALGQFAWIAVLGLPLLAGLVLRLCGAFAWDHRALQLSLGLSVLQLVLHLLGSSHLSKLLYVVITLVGAPIGLVLSHVLLAVTFYGVLTPIGLVFRLVGRDAMGKKLDPAKTSYWHDRGQARPPASYFKLY